MAFQAVRSLPGRFWRPGGAARLLIMRYRLTRLQELWLNTKLWPSQMDTWSPPEPRRTRSSPIWSASSLQQAQPPCLDLLPPQDNLVRLSADEAQLCPLGWGPSRQPRFCMESGAFGQYWPATPWLLDSH